MLVFVIRRCAQAIPTLIGVSIVVFLLVRAIPGNAADVLLGPQATSEQTAALTSQMGLDRPIWVQYGIWIEDVVRGNLGRSWINDFPVSTLVWRNLVATMQLALVSLALALLIAFPIGIVGALRPGGVLGRATRAYTILAIGIPSFWLGILLVLLVSLRLQWLPPSGYVAPTADFWQWLKLISLPAITLAVYVSAVLARFIQASILETLGNDYVRTAKAKGLAPRAVLIGHVMRNALLPIVTMIGLQAGGLLGGAVVVESIFAWPGIGRLLVSSIETRDYLVVQAIILIGATLFLLINLITDVLYGVLDPRIRAR